MPKPVELNRGDNCPACDGELVAARVPSDEEFTRAFDRENPVSMKPGTDTASPTQRAELGALYRCGRCGYQARFRDAGDAGAVNGDAKTKRAK